MWIFYEAYTPRRMPSIRRLPHIDRFLRWHQLSMTQKLNCICDYQAKSEVYRAIRYGSIHALKSLLPREDIAMFIGGEKMTNSFDKSEKEIRFDIGKQSAKQFITKELKTHKCWNEEQFKTDRFNCVPMIGCVALLSDYIVSKM